MKKKPLSRLVAMLLTALVPLLSPAVNTIIYNATYDFNELTLGTDTLGGVTYTTVNYEGLYNGGDPGKPSLPIDYIKLSVPYNATNFTVTATLQNNVIQTLGNLDQLVYPCQPARMMNDTTPVVIVPPDSSVYFSSSYYPGQNAWVVDEGFLAGENHIVTIAVMPVSYMHNKTGAITTNKIKKSHTVRLTLSYDLSDNPAMSPIIRQDTTLRQEGYALTRSMVANPSNVLANAPIELSIDPMDIVNPNSGDGINGGGVDPPGQGIYTDSLIHDNIELDIAKECAYLIVTTPELKHSVRRIAALKRQKGYTVKVVTMNEVLNNSVSGSGDLALNNLGEYEVAYSDDAGFLRQYLKKAYRQDKLDYVFFVGNVPYRYAYKFKSFAVSDSCPSDLYFSDLHGFWSSDAYKAKIDINPELFVGRLLVTEEQDVINYTNKLFKYELNPGNGDLSYIKRILYSVCTDFQKRGCPKTLDKYYKKVFNDSTTFLEDTINHRPSGADIVNSINNNKYGYVSMINHAGPSGIITSCKHPAYYLWAIDTIRVKYNNQIDSLDPYVSDGINSINNTNYPFIIYSVGCTTIPFDTVPHYENVRINCGESFTLGKDYGGPAFLGNTREGTVGGSDYLEEKFAMHLSMGTRHIGKTESMSKVSYSNNPDICKVHNLLGDPEFEIWTDIPQEYQNISIIRTDNSVTLSGIDIANTIVSCCNNDGVIIKKPATSNVVYLSEMAPNASVMLYRHNCIPFIVPMVLQNISLKKSQYVVASDFTAGFSVDSNRTYGNVVVKNGVEYEIEASGTVTLLDGFVVEKGATFAVYPSTF